MKAPSKVIQGRILVVDDELGIRDLMRVSLSMAGYAVVTAPDGLSALEEAKKQSFDAVLLDITMPGIDGVETLRRLLAHDPQLQVVMATGYATVDTAVKAMKLGAFDFISKPFEVDAVLASFARAIEVRQLRTANNLLRATQSLMFCQDARQVTSELIPLAAEALGAAAAALHVAGDEDSPALEAAWPAGLCEQAERALERARVAPEGAPAKVVEKYDEAHEWIVHPLVRGERWMGALVLVRAKSRGAVTSSDTERLAVLASQAALAIENARLLGKLNAQLAEISEARDQLVHAEKMSAIGKLTAGIVHDMSAPIMLIREGLVSVTAALDPVNPELSEALGFIRTGSVRLLEMVNHLKRFSRKQSAAEARLPVSMTQAVREAAELAIPVTKDRCRVRLHEAESDLVSCHINQVRQVFMNLILNAADAVSREDGAIDVFVETAANEVVVEVKDNGTGMPAEVAERIFEPFFTTKPAGAGTGLGLSVSMDIVRQHGGTIEVQTAPGLGTSMRVRLPRASMPSCAQPRDGSASTLPAKAA